MKRLTISNVFEVVFVFALFSQPCFGRNTSYEDNTSETAVTNLQTLMLSNLKLGFYKSSIEFVLFELNEPFSPGFYNYTATVEKSYTDSVIIIPEQSSGTIGIIKINGVETKAGVPLKVNLNLGDNSFNIYVTAQNGASVNYKLTITQKDLSTVYVSELVAPGIWRIRDFGGFIGNEDMYLIEGKDKALLFDTGMGTGDLATYIKTLTKLPIEVAITHGHGDHFRQLDQFRESTVYMSNKDKLPAEIITPKFQWIKEGDVIDIGGGRKFEVIEIPGHSLGSVIFLDSQNKIAVIGDAIGSGSMVYMFSSTASLANYVDVLKKVEEKIKNLDGLTLLTGHHYQEKTPLIETAGKQYFTDMRIVTEKVLNGEIVGKVAYNTRGGMTTELRQAYYGLAGLWYNPNDKGIVKK